MNSRRAGSSSSPPEELKALAEASRQTIDIVEFIPEQAIDPIYYDKAYFLAPDKRGAKPYSLLLRAMRTRGRSALAKWAFRSKEYVVQIRAAQGGMVLQQLLYADEVRSLADLDIGLVPVGEAELKLAKQLIEQISAEAYDPTHFVDEEKQRILAAVEQKIEGQQIVAPAHRRRSDRRPGGRPGRGPARQPAGQAPAGGGPGRDRERREAGGGRAQAGQAGGGPRQGSGLDEASGRQALAGIGGGGRRPGGAYLAVLRHRFQIAAAQLVVGDCLRARLQGGVGGGERGRRPSVARGGERAMADPADRDLVGACEHVFACCGERDQAFGLRERPRRRRRAPTPPRPVQPSRRGEGHAELRRRRMRAWKAASAASRSPRASSTPPRQYKVTPSP